MNTSIGKNVKRKDAWEKVTGQAKYTDDLPAVGFLTAVLLRSPYAHARICDIDLRQAWAVEGVKAIITGEDILEKFGPLLKDRPAIAVEKVRYAGEPVALIVAIDEPAAKLAAEKIIVQYEPLPVLLKPSEAVREGAQLVHESCNAYRKEMTDIYPEAGTNIASRYRIIKGNAAKAFSGCDIIVKQKYSLPPSGHLAMEVRTARCEITAEGTVEITTSSQAPFAVRTQIAEVFNIPAGSIRVYVPFVGGGFGGKAAVMPEILAYIASKTVGGRAVRLVMTREQDIETAPCRMGLDAEITFGANKNGVIVAADMTYLLDSGAYADISPYMAKAIAVDCTGPYNIENVHCEALSVYTNHTYATSFRGFSHESFTFCVERTLDILSHKINVDPLELRFKNAIRPGNLTPSQVECTLSLMGNLPECITKLKPLSEWDGGKAIKLKQDVVRAKGVSCFWKTENPPTDAISGALITFNPDGSMNLNTGVVEIGAGGQTRLAQMLAEKFKIDADEIHVVMPVDTRLNPEHWKTVASLTEFMAGNAVMKAADDMLAQLRAIGAQVLKCLSEEIEIAHYRVFMRSNPDNFILLKDIVNGYKTKDNESIGEPVLGRGSYKLKGLSMLEPKTGKGRTGPDWTVGAQAVEIEFNTKTYTYRIISASTVIDVGALINPEAMRAMVAGGMAMGISLGSREAYHYDNNGLLQTPNLRTYKLMHIGQEPEYRVDFVETPLENSPFGIRSFTEHGILGIPAALGNAISSALGKDVTELPITPEKLWRLNEVKDNDTV